MRRFLDKVSIVDFMVMIAILMIVSAIVLPHFAQAKKAPRAAQAQHVTVAARKAR